jgi:phage-related protein
VFFCVHDKHLVLLHGFIKKERATPKKELDLANRRKREVEYERRK